MKLESDNQVRSIATLEPYVVSLYKSGKSTLEIGQMLGFSSEGIRKFLKRMNVRRRSQTETSRVHLLNHQYFRTVNTAKKAYWLGFIVHRGIIVNRGNDSWNIVVPVTLDKLELLKQLRQEIASTKPIYKSSKRNRYVLSISSKSWADSLNKLDWKSFRLGDQKELLSKINSELHESFFEGYKAAE